MLGKDYKLSWHSIQHSLDVSLMKLHMTKPTQGTHGLNPIPAYFDIVTGHMIRTKSQKIELDVGNAISSNNPIVLVPKYIQLYRKRISFLPVQINWNTAFFFSETWGVQIIRNCVVCYHSLYLPIMGLFL